MEASLEIVMISTGCVGIISNIIILLVVLITRRTTPTYLYIMYAAFLAILEQCVSPTFHHLYLSNFNTSYDEQEIMNLIFMILICGKIILMNFFLLMDRFRWISNHKWIVLTIHFILMAIFSLAYFAFERKYHMRHFLSFIIVLLFACFAIQQLLQGEIKMLTKREEDDDESRLRKVLVVTFLCAICGSVIIFALEQCILVLFALWRYNIYFCVGMYQLVPMFLLIALVKTDHSFKRDSIELFKMSNKPSWIISKFQSLPNDNGQLLRQNV